MTPFRRHKNSDASRPPWVRAALALHEPEAQMLADMLRQEGIPSLIRRTTMDVPDMLAGGPREILVPEDSLMRAREILNAQTDAEDA